MAAILHHDQWLRKEQLLGLRMADTVPVGALAGVAVVPVKADDPGEVDHGCILPPYTQGAIP